MIAKALRPPMFATVALTLAIYLMLVLAFFLTGKPPTPVPISLLLICALIISPAVLASIWGYLRIRKLYNYTPRLTFIALLYWLLVLISLLKFPLGAPSDIGFMLMDLLPNDEPATMNKYYYLLTSSIHVIVFIPAILIWSLTAEKIVLAPTMALKISSITNIGLKTTKKESWGCMIFIMIGAFLYFVLGLLVSGGALSILPIVLLLEFTSAMAATSLYEIEQRKFYILIAIWFIPAITMLIELVISGGPSYFY